MDGRDIVTSALGESTAGVPATTAMHFRNGAVSFTYMGSLLAVLAGRGELDLDAPISTWLPALPHSSEITVRMLANMTSGYADYVYQPQVLVGTDADPFRQWRNDELIQIGVSRPLMFTPGTNWGYSHTNYIVLGQVVEQLTRRPLAAVMDDLVLRPMGLRNTVSSTTAAIPPPVLHSYSSERRSFLQIPAGEPFIERKGSGRQPELDRDAPPRRVAGAGPPVGPELRTIAARAVSAAQPSPRAGSPCRCRASAHRS